MWSSGRRLSLITNTFKATSRTQARQTQTTNIKNKARKRNTTIVEEFLFIETRLQNKTKINNRFASWSRVDTFPTEISITMK